MININCDLGEGLNNEHILMPLINSCNIACGGHAGDSQSMIECVEISIRNHVSIGAHPSYPDKENFGRKKIDISRSELHDSILNQIEELNLIASSYGVKLHHIKAHGALYNQMFTDKDLSDFYLETINSFKEECYIYVPFNSEIEKSALRKGFKIMYEAFGDRKYNDDLSLVSRDKKDALINTPNLVIDQITNIKDLKKIKSINGIYRSIEADTICIHSDTDNSIEILKRINEVFKNKD
tara:strand:+ start:10682 stop:11398 length:717 start_codon:yes stop_codon:yes gene_type:complete